jgi:hypothetical protein
VTIHPARYYGVREGHWRIIDRNDAPPPCDDAKAFLYIIMFQGIAKVGVSASPGDRIATHERQRRERMQCAYLVILDRAEAFTRERVIKDLFAARTTPKGRSGEWFPLASLPEAVLVMRNPETAQWIDTLRCLKSDFAEDGHDPRFELKSKAGLWRGEFAA